MTTYDLQFKGNLTGKFTNISQGKLVYLLTTYCDKAKGSISKDQMYQQMNMYNMITNDNATLVLPFTKPYVKKEFSATIIFHHHK